LTGFRLGRYDAREGGVAIPGSGRSEYDFERLEQAVAELVRAQRRQVEETASLRRRLEERNRRIRGLEEQLLEANQKRQDVAKRIDELISQLDHLDAQLGAPDLQVPPA
jgi:septal ring factor EnvC (AmiA/AmiB activator)